MKKQILKAALAGLIFACAAIFTGCADANGLHNQQAVNVVIKFVNFPESVTGEYSIPGDFNGDDAWENAIDNVDIQMKDGEGTSNSIKVTSDWIKFSLVKTKDTSWLRGWFPTIKGNAADKGKYYNFWTDIDLTAGDVTIVVDGSTGTAVLTIE